MAVAEETQKHEASGSFSPSSRWLRRGYSNNQNTDYNRVKSQAWLAGKPEILSAQIILNREWHSGDMLL
jgi:hypothetical protein